MTSQPNEPPAVAVLDTNVLLDVFSCHDLSAKVDKVAADGGPIADDASVVHRRARARESLLLAMYFDATGATTHSLLNEADGMLTRAVPPGEESLETHYTTLFVWFTKELLLARWDARVVAPVAGWEGILSTTLPLEGREATAPTGSRADAWHIAWAKAHGLPLITNEGFSPAGYEPGKIAKRAAMDGVRVMFPKDFYAGKIDEAAEIEGFFGRFREHAPAYLERHSSHRNSLEMMFGVLRHVLLGETDGRDSPV
jgi:hypothetical protein